MSCTSSPPCGGTRWLVEFVKCETSLGNSGTSSQSTHKLGGKENGVLEVIPNLAKSVLIDLIKGSVAQLIRWQNPYFFGW
jgi:hypothetical protein